MCHSFLFRSSEDLVHRLFVCIAGVADQLQTNFAGDLRHILKCVFLMSASSSMSTEEEDLEERPVTTLSVEQEQPLLPLGDNGKQMLSLATVWYMLTVCSANSTLNPHFVKEMLSITVADQIEINLQLI
jgi:hypothetical protein